MHTSATMSAIGTSCSASCRPTNGKLRCGSAAGSAPRTATPRSLRWNAATAALAGVFALAGCRQDMQNQPKLIPQRGSEMFADHRGARPQVVNTVARGQLHAHALEERLQVVAFGH